MNKQLKLFLENFIFYGGLSMLQKALPFLTLPIITSLLPDSSSYGIADMFTLLVSFGSALAILGMYDAMFREFFEDENNFEYKKKVTSTGLNIVLISGLIVMFLVILFNKFLSNILFKDIRYSKLILISGIAILISALNTIIASPTRMRNQRKIFLITGLLFPIIGFASTYFFIKKGYTYEALVYGTVSMNSTSLIVFFILNHKDFSLKILDKKVAKELLKIGIPLLPTFLIYWIFNSMDRIMINKMIGSSELGVYSVGSKVASVSQLIHLAFAGGWSYFSFSTMKDEKQVKNNSKVFEYLGIVSLIAFILTLPFIKLVFDTFFKGDYIRGQEVFPYIFLSPLLLMLFQVLANQMIIIKKSYLSTLSLVSGAILNIILNYILIKSYGIRGAAFSTLISYVISVIIMSLICIKYEQLILEKKFIFISAILFLGLVISFYFENNISLIYGIYLFVLFLILVLYTKDIKDVFKNIKK